jgi:hypothetical protein
MLPLDRPTAPSFNRRVDLLAEVRPCRGRHPRAPQGFHNVPRAADRHGPPGVSRSRLPQRKLGLEWTLSIVPGETDLLGWHWHMSVHQAARGWQVPLAERTGRHAAVRCGVVGAAPGLLGDQRGVAPGKGPRS